MRTIKLSNGATVSAYVGDGFDGSSGLYAYSPDRHGPNKVEPVQIPDADLGKAKRLLEWYVRAEMALRRREGDGYMSENEHPDFDIPHLRNPYQVNYLLGKIDAREKCLRRRT